MTMKESRFTDGTENRLTLGELIHAHRRRRDMSLRALGHASLLSQGYLCDVESNKQSMSAHNLANVLAALGLKFADLDALRWVKRPECRS